MKIRYIPGATKPNYIEQSNYSDGIVIYHWQTFPEVFTFTVAVFKVRWK